MIAKVVLLLGLLFTTVLAFGQRSVTVNLPSGGDYSVFAAEGYPSSPPTDPQRVTGGTATVVIPSDGSRVFAWDHKTGGLASADASKVTDAWSPKPADFSDLAQVRVAVTYAGKPVAAAQVELNDGRRTMSSLVDPSAKGVAEFFDVKAGTARVKVSTRSAGGAAKPVTQIFDLPRERSEAVPRLSVALVEPVQTLDAAGSPASTNSTGAAPTANGGTGSTVATPATPQPPASPFASLVIYVLALAAAVGVGYGVMRYMRQNPELVTSKLEQLGVQVPKPGDAPLATPDPAPAAPVKPQPPQKIILDDAPSGMGDPIDLSTPSTPVGQTSGGSVSGPSLVSDAGTPLPLGDGETIVGREVGLGLSLTGESTVSRQHARLTRTGNEVTLTDLGSTNGTFVNGARLSPQAATTLRPGDAVQFGAVAFRYEA